MTDSKWFYPASKKISDYLTQHFGDNYRCEFQDVCEEVVYDTFQCWKPQEEGFQQETQRITFIIHKRKGGENGPALIEVMYGQYEHTMQYFKDGKRSALFP